jgi:CheY-like chemotaxis protein
MAQRVALVIEDHVDLAEIYKITLDMAGYSTELVTDGREALERLQGDDKPDLVILDMNLPQVSGHYIYKKLRADPEWNVIPVIISTANTIVANALADEVTAQDQIVVKPVSPRKLKEIIAKIDASRAEEIDDSTTENAAEETTDAPTSSGKSDNLKDEKQAEDSMSNN